MALFARWEKWRAQGREAEAEWQRDGLLRRMFLESPDCGFVRLPFVLVQRLSLPHRLRFAVEALPVVLLETGLFVLRSPGLRSGSQK